MQANTLKMILQLLLSHLSTLPSLLCVASKAQRDGHGMGRVEQASSTVCRGDLRDGTPCPNLQWTGPWFPYVNRRTEAIGAAVRQDSQREGGEGELHGAEATIATRASGADAGEEQLEEAEGEIEEEKFEEQEEEEEEELSLAMRKKGSFVAVTASSASSLIADDVLRQSVSYFTTSSSC